MHKPKQQAIIVDLDGTLCNTAHRQHHMECKPKNWEAFYAGIAQDKPNPWCLALIAGMYELRTKIIFVSGRPDNYREDTENWIMEHTVNTRHNPVLMRKAGDFRKDALVKTEIYKTHIEPYYDVIFCVDDRKQVTDAWRALGLVCLQCAPGEF